MSDFEVVVLGVGDTFSERHHGASLLLCHDGFRLAIDCPDGYRAVLKAAADRSGRALPVASVDHVLITHVHGDHMNGLEGLAFYKHFVEGKRLGLVTSPEVRGAIWDERLRASMGVLWNGQTFRELMFDDYFVHTPLSWSGETRVGPFRILARRTLHHVPTSALLVEAGGRRLGYSGDTAFDPELIDFLAGADVIVHETNYGPAHTPYERLAALPAPIRDRMRLIHYSDAFDADASTIAVLREGEVFSVAR